MIPNVAPASVWFGHPGRCAGVPPDRHCIREQPTFVLLQQSLYLGHLVCRVAVFPLVVNSTVNISKTKLCMSVKAVYMHLEEEGTEIYHS